jgi:very-short-patch-repair endonuclease
LSTKKCSLISKSKKIHEQKYNYDFVEYVNSKTKVKILCNKCNNIFEQIPYNHLRGRGCPKCNESKGEIKVAKYLTENNISFIPQKTFKTLRDKRHLKLDFYLDDINLLIEYDGEYHYKAKRGSTPEIKQKNLEIQQRRDKIKNEWAKANNIPLLRIPYWDFDRIEELIEAFILQHSKKKEIKQLVLEM